MCPQLCLTLCCSMDGSPPVSSVHGISQARILEWVAISFSRGSSHPIYWNCISYIPALAGRFLSTGTIWEAAFIVCVKFLFIDSLKIILQMKQVTPLNFIWFIQDFSSVQFSRSFISNSLWPHGPQHARPPCPSPTPSLLTFTSIELVMPSNHLIRCCPLLLLPSISPSIRVFSNESALCMRWPKYLSFNFNISPYNEHSGLISFGMDWLDLLIVHLAWYKNIYHL